MLTCAELPLQNTSAWAAALSPKTSTLLTLKEAQAVLLAAWETAAELLPAVMGGPARMR